MKKKSYLNLYKAWMRAGKLPANSGLCQSFHNVGLGYYDPLLYMFEPTEEECIRYGLCPWWGGDGYNPQVGEFTPMRQTIVLFLAAMNDELWGAVVNAQEIDKLFW